MKVLVVDDAKFMRTVLGSILQKMGCEVVEAENGLEAIERYEKHRPDLVTMDITMPGMDGVEAVKRLREVDPSAKIIMVSAMGQKDFVLKSIQYGALDFIVKPFQEERVRSAVEKALKGVQKLAEKTVHK
ncbi:response regulator [Desulfovirgula thermocuniculi]|uniref:response regulator n=1 Tax=Desulfovirgula thermocuniculi TaxID=348842 RepID=UPI000403CE2C|nr:response regulator [Desulfovirgula thermocuniculi]